jgi:omega-amidase
LPHVHLVQLDIAWEAPERNCTRVMDLLSGTRPQPGDLVLLPEMFDTGFSVNIPRTADNGQTLAFLQSLVSKFAVLVQGGRTVLTASGPQNVMTILGPSTEHPAEYAKVHPFGKEVGIMVPGCDVVLYDWPGAGLRIAPAICYDLRFPELFRAALSRGAQAYAIGACWPAIRHNHWRALLCARAIENQAFVFACNRVGCDPPPPAGPGLTYAGGSLVIGPRGEILGELASAEGVLSVEIDPSLLHRWRAEFPAWREA